MPGGLRAGSERSWIDGVAFAQECGAASPCSSAATVTDPLIGFLVTEHTGVLIVEIDLTKIGPVSRAIPFGSDPARSAPLRDAAPRTAQTMATERTDRRRTECSLCMGLSRCMVGSLGIQRRTRRFKISRMPSGSLPLGRWRSRRHKRRKILRPRRPSFRQTPRTHSMPRGVPKRACRLPDNAFLRRGMTIRSTMTPRVPSRAGANGFPAKRLLFGILRSRFPPLAALSNLRR